MKEFLSNPITVATFTAWLFAQILKVPLEALQTKKWDWGLFFDPGHMPSSHSAVMTAVTTSIGLTTGWGSPVFLLALCITGIVIYDAAGVRRQSGFHAVRINIILEQLKKMEKWDQAEMKTLAEIIGHSPAEAAVGAIFGTFVGLLVCKLMGVY
ncbi:MAG TPA: divergent PAP2 family protein [Anaerolineaceae bacterium]|nr:divergent PAP2 family protein [Anaerolineaceae bacterium]